MIQSQEIFLESIERINNNFKDFQFYPIQKAFTSAHYLVFSIRFPGITQFVYLGRGRKYQGLYVYEKNIPSSDRVQDQYLDYFRKYLVGAKVGKFQGDENYKFFWFQFKNFEEDNFFLFGYSLNLAFFAIRMKGENYLSLDGKKNQLSWENFIEEMLSKHNIDKIDSVNANKNQTKMSFWEDSFIDKKMAVNNKKNVFNKRKIQNIQNDLIKVDRYVELERIINSADWESLIEAVDWKEYKIKIQTSQSKWQIKEAAFEKIKKMKRAKSILLARLESTISESQENLAVVVNVIREDGSRSRSSEPTIPILLAPAIKNSAKLKNNSHEKEYRQFKIGEIEGAIGMNAHGNDQIRHDFPKHWWWFHLEDYPSAHAVLNISTIDLDVLSILAGVICDKLNNSSSECQLVYTELKNIKGKKGASGSVIVNKGKYLRIKINESWRSLIRYS